MSRTGLLIFARMESRRLPGKVMCDIAGRPLLGRVIDRSRRVRCGSPIVVATSGRAADDAIAEFAASEGVEIFRGPADDTLARALMCARAHRLDAVARITADSPFVQPDLVDALIGRRSEEKLDLATNVFPRSFPAGISVEVVSADALARADRATRDPGDREHCTGYFYRHPEKFRVSNLSAPDRRHAAVSLAVDTPEDLARTDWIVRRLGDREPNASLDELVALASAWSATSEAAAPQEAAP